MLSILENRTFILASKSPRRRELLQKAGLHFKVKAADIEEVIEKNKPVHQQLQKVALDKAGEVGKTDQGIIIGADTVVVYKSDILGKPRNKNEAVNMLSALSGKTHKVITGYAILDNVNKKSQTGAISTEVTFFDLTAEEINWYVQNENVLDKAGAYAIQEKGMLLVEKISGSYSNVVGLPVEYLIRDIEKILK